MANMNFGVNILPKANNTYSLGNSDYKWNIFANTINGTAVVNLTLPAVTASNNGQILQVSNGAWAAVDATFLTSHQDISHLAPKASPEFTGSISMRRLANSTVGLNSMAIGYGTTASANEAIATGYYTVASGTDSTAIGYYTTASAQRAFASGDSTTASNNNAHAEGYHTTASGSESHAEGSNTTASNYSSHAEGYNTIASGYYSHAEGRDTLAYGTDSHAEGWGGKVYINNQQVDAGAIGSQSHSEGYLTRASGSYSHAEGGYTVASDSGAHAEGYQATASGYISHAEGINTQATAYASHAEGYYTVASNSQTHAEGANTNASGYCAHAEGYNTTASNSYTHAEGEYTIAAGTHQHVSGKYNVEDTFQGYEEWEANKSYAVGDIVKVTTIYNNKTYREIYKCKTANSDSTFTSSHWNYASGSSYAEIIGNGTADDARSNARVLDWSGNERLMGDLYVGCASNSSGGNKVATETYVSTAINNIVFPTSSVMEGATLSTDGAAGLVPAPETGEEDYFLKGDGTWSEVSIPEMIGASEYDDGIAGLVPAPEAGEESGFLRGDGNWATPEFSEMVGADSVNDGTSGVVPAPYAGDEEKFLKGDGTWDTPVIDTMVGATGSSNGESGVVPAPVSGEENYFLRGDGTWAEPDQPVIPEMSGATDISDGEGGLVPAPYSGDEAKFLMGDGTWSDLPEMSGADSSYDGAGGMVPTPLMGDENKFLRGDGTWADLYEMTGATSSTNGESGAVPAPAVGEEDYFLKGDGTWSALTAAEMVGATDSTDGEGGSVPAPLTGEENLFLRGDGTWASPETGMPFPQDLSFIQTDGTYNYTAVVDNGDVSFEFVETPEMTGATSNAAGASGLVPAPSAGDENKFLAGDGTFKSGGLPMVILSYGSSTWTDFINAYNNNVIVYARASSNSNPASGSQTRMAFMAYVNNATTPTEVEFQYYRSMSSHSATAMGDQVFVYKLNKTNGWSVTTRDASIKQIKVDTNDPGTVSWSGNVVTLKSGLPKVTSADEGKILKVVNGAWAAVDP